MKLKITDQLNNINPKNLAMCKINNAQIGELLYRAVCNSVRTTLRPRDKV